MNGKSCACFQWNVTFVKCKIRCGSLIMNYFRMWNVVHKCEDQGILDEIHNLKLYVQVQQIRKMTFPHTKMQCLYFKKMLSENYKVYY